MVQIIDTLQAPIAVRSFSLKKHFLKIEDIFLDVINVTHYIVSAFPKHFRHFTGISNHISVILFLLYIF